MKYYSVIFSFLLIFTNGALAQDDADKPFKPFTVYEDKSSPNRYVPSGYMPNGECLAVNDSHQENCYQGTTCVRIDYDVNCSQKSRRWAGVYWLHPADNWGDKKGGFNLTGATRLVFWAKGSKGGETIAEFKVGGIGQSNDFPDSDSATIGPVILTDQWREYEIDLRDKDLSNIAGGFAWVANVDDNKEPIRFFLDDIRFE